jgi:hypothetical protein
VRGEEGTLVPITVAVHGQLVRAALQQQLAPCQVVRQRLITGVTVGGGALKLKGAAPFVAELLMYRHVVRMGNTAAAALLLLALLLASPDGIVRGHLQYLLLLLPSLSSWQLQAWRAFSTYGRMAKYGVLCVSGGSTSPAVWSWAASRCRT